MKKKINDLVVKNWITSILGIVIMAFSGLLLWKNINALTWEAILMSGALGALGFIFLFVKDELITSFLPKR
jgi:ABC-type bacteriocin/lantibiotic exporter with double-glycine peptidase domain